MDVKPGYKQTEVGEIPEDWDINRVGNIAVAVVSGKSRVFSQFGDYPVYGSTGIIGYSNKYDYSGRAILIARVGANAGRLNVVDGCYGVTDNTIILRIDTSCRFDYLSRQLEAARLNSMVFGSGQPLITGTQIKMLLFPIPTITEQEAIAEALSDVDALIESLEQLIAKKRAIKQGAMQELLTGKRRLPGFGDKSKGYKQTEVGLIPEDWGVESINQISSPVRGGSPRPAGDSRYFNGTFIPWLTVAALTNIPSSQLVVTETATCLTEEGSLHSRILDKGTLIIANSGATLGVAKILGMKCCANDGIAALLNVKKNVSPLYLAYYINTKTTHLRDNVASGNGQPNLNTELIGRFKFPLPSVKTEQEAIAGMLTDMDEESLALETKLGKYRQIKQGMMQELLTGRIRLV